MDLARALAVAKEACGVARQIQLDRFGGDLQVKDKGKEGLVSEADVLSEEAIRKVLLSAFPDIPVFGEEEAFRQRTVLQETSWIVDPLDGTTNYIYGLPIYCISVGLQIKGEVVAGLVDVPPWNRQYTAIKGEGAFLNGKKIAVSERKKLSESLLATGFYPADKASLSSQLHIFSRLVEKSQAVRRAGAAALDLCLVAEGVFDAFWESNLKPWDTAAGSLLVKEAGGLVCDFQGEDFSVQQNSIVASNPFIYPLIKPDLVST